MSECKSRRITLDLSVRAAAEAKILQRHTGLTTADLFRFALTLFGIYVDARRDGKELLIRDPKNPEIMDRIEMPFRV